MGDRLRPHRDEVRRSAHGSDQLRGVGAAFVVRFSGSFDSGQGGKSICAHLSGSRCVWVLGVICDDDSDGERSEPAIRKPHHVPTVADSVIRCLRSRSR